MLGGAAWYVSSVASAAGVGTASAVGEAATPTTDLQLILKILGNRQELDATTGTFRLYDDDGVTILYEVGAWADTAGTVPYSGGVLARLDRLQ